MHATFWLGIEQCSNWYLNLVSDDSGPRLSWHTSARKMESIYGAWCQFLERLSSSSSSYRPFIVRLLQNLHKCITPSQHYITRKPCYRKDDRAMRPIYGCPEKFRQSSQTPPATFPEICKVLFVPIDTKNVHTKFEVRSFICFWDNKEYSKNLGSPSIRPLSVFSQIFKRLLFGWTLFSVIYADDKQAYVDTPVSDVPTARVTLQTCIRDVGGWCSSHRLQLNETKTELIWFGSKNILGKVPESELSLTVGSAKIQPVASVRDLGVLEVRSFIRSWDNTGYSKNLGSPCIRTRSSFSQIFNRLLFVLTLWIYLPNLKFVALPIPEVIGGTPKIWGVPGFAHAPYSPKFIKGFCSYGRCEYTCQIWSS